MQAVRTTCPYCGVGCGLIARHQDRQIILKGDKAHPANHGRLCSKGATLADTLDHEGRLLHPEVNGQQCDWDQALRTVADRFADTIARHGPDAVAFYVSGQLLTEDYYVANKLMKGFIGSANIDTNSRLCMSSVVAAQKRAFGSDTVPGCYEDLDQAELVVLAGSNAAWCHPVLFQRIQAAKEQHPDRRMVVIDPRRTASAEGADLHLPIAPGSDALLWNGLLHYLRQHDRLDFNYLEPHCQDFAATLEAAAQSAGSIPVVARGCHLPETQIATFYQWFSQTERVVSAFSQGINQSSSGTDKVNALINCHLLSGRIGRPGMGPFSLTGQPNAMGGREVGGLANQLAAHMELENPEHRRLVQTFWNAPRMAEQPGYKAVPLFQAIGEGRVKAVWIMGTNPMVSLPDADQARAALAQCDFVAVSDCVRHTDTTALAHVLLPALAWGEKEGTVTNSERRISRQRAFLPPPGEARADWWIISEVARRLGFADRFPYRCPAEIFREHAALSGHDNQGARAFDISELADISEAAYGAMQPIQWPVNGKHPRGQARLFGAGDFHTVNHKAHLIAVVPRAPVHPCNVAYPLVLNTGRIRDQWHTMTRTGKAARLASHLPEPFVQIHPEDAVNYQVSDGGVARINSRWGTMLARVQISEEQAAGSLFIPIHWNDQFARQARVDAVVNPATDPISGEPEFKHTPVMISPWQAAWYGYVLSVRALQIPDADYCVRIREQGFYRYEIAGGRPLEDYPTWARSFLCTRDDAVEWTDYLDKASGRYRGLRIHQEQLDSCIFISRDKDLPASSWPASFFTHQDIDAKTRIALLAGTPPKDTRDAGRTVCSCFGVGEQTLLDAIHKNGLRSCTAIGEHLKAGTNCGSCLPEIKKLIAHNS